MNIKRPRLLNTDQLQLGDVVRLSNSDGPWSWCIVKNVTKEEVTLFRPYGTSTDFASTGGVICYIGLEEYKAPLKSAAVWILAERKEVR